MKFDKIKNHLEKRLILLESHLMKVERNLSKVSVIGEAAVLANEKVIDKIHNETRLINLALDQMVEGSYGICKFCGKRISYQQLERFPYSGQCSSCRNR